MKSIKLILIITAVLCVPSALAGKICNSFGNLSQSAAESRDSGVPMSLSLKVTDMASETPDAKMVNSSLVKLAYSMPDKSPIDVRDIAIAVCLTKLGDI